MADRPSEAVTRLIGTPAPSTTRSQALKGGVAAQLLAAQLSTNNVARVASSATPSLPDIRKALDTAARALEGTRVPREGSGPVDSAWAAFFDVSALEPDPAVTWADVFPRIELTPAQLDESARRPVTLAPLNIALYRGHLFPDAYFVRSTMYWNDYRERFDYVSPDLPKLGGDMPYLRLGASGTVEVHRSGGAEQLLAMLGEDLGGATHLTAYRGCSRTEVAVQGLIADLLQGAGGAPLSRAERARFEALVRRDDELSSALPALEAGARRAETATSLARLLGARNEATFVSNSRAKAVDFLDDPEESGADVVAEYRIPFAELAQHVRRGSVYVGVEFDALELGFGAKSSEDVDQRSKFLLYRALVQ